MRFHTKEREDKSVLREPRCPFCRELFERPADIPTDLGFFYGGVCRCSAVYACDPTGRNLGEAYMDALAYACNQDWERALSLTPEEDYSEVVLSYEPRTHTIHFKGMGCQGTATGRLFFIKLR